MRICYIGNITWHEAKWAEYFVKNGHDVCFLAGKSPYFSNVEYDLVGVDIYYLPVLAIKNNNIRFIVNNTIMLPVILYEVKKYLSLRKPDVIHAHSAQYGFLASLSGFRPYIFTPMGSDILIMATKYFLYRILARIAYKNADVVTGDSKVIQKKGFVLGAKQGNNYIIQNGVDTSMFNTSVNKYKTRKLLKINDNNPIILSSRSFKPLYNIETIIKTIPHVLEFRQDAKFVFIYGSKTDECYSKVTKLIDDLKLHNNIYLIDFLEYKYIPQYVASASIYISIPSSDSSPKSVYEAFACGIPCIINDLPWIKQYIKKNKNAYVISNKPSPIELANAIIKILDNSKLRKEIVNGGLDLVAKHLDYENNMRNMENIMLSLYEKSTV